MDKENKKINLSLCSWIFKDDQRISGADADRDLLCGYLRERGIVPEDNFKKDLENNNWYAWRYPAFAVKHFSSDPVLSKKLFLLCKMRGSDSNDIKRNYQNQLVEFHALYLFIALMGYQFDGWDKQSRKSGVDPEKDCDLVLIKDGQKVFVDVKDVSSEILSQDNSQHADMIHYTPKIELNYWIKGCIKNVEKKGANVLVCHTPGWGLTNFDEPIIKQWLDSILPGDLSWVNNMPRWTIESKSVSQIVIIKREGCIIIQIGK